MSETALKTLVCIHFLDESDVRKPERNVKTVQQAATEDFSYRLIIIIHSNLGFDVLVPVFCRSRKRSQDFLVYRNSFSNWQTRCFLRENFCCFDVVIIRHGIWPSADQQERETDGR